jgi:hypothetical protein
MSESDGIEVQHALSFYMIMQEAIEDDINFANECGIEFLIHTIPERSIRSVYIPTISDVINQSNENDSGWCDAATGCRIVTSMDRIVYVFISRRICNIKTHI